MSDQQNPWWADAADTSPPTASPTPAGTNSTPAGPMPPGATVAADAHGRLPADPDATVVVPARHPGAPPAGPGSGGTPAQYAPQHTAFGARQPGPPHPNDAWPNHPTPNDANRHPHTFPQQAPAPYGGPQFVDPSSRVGTYRAPGGATTMIAGALVSIIGTFLPWVTFGNDSVNGYDTYPIGDDFDAVQWTNPGAYVVGAMVLVIISAVIVLAAGRRVATWIIALLAAGFGGLMALGGLGAVGSVLDNAFFDDLNIGFGVGLCLLGAVIAGVGAIIVAAKRS
ncbi:MAG: hypothetical protein ABJ382_19760 [Ilumatobacter sp.]